VKIIIDADTKDFQIEVGSPPVASLIKKELGIQKGSGQAGHARPGDLSTDQVKKLANMKFGSDDNANVSQIIGACRSMGVTIDRGKLTAEEVKAAEKSRAKKEEAAPKPAEPQPQAEKPEAKPEKEPAQKQKKSEWKKK